jgi:hypothetical protein
MSNETVDEVPSLTLEQKAAAATRRGKSPQLASRLYEIERQQGLREQFPPQTQPLVLFQNRIWGLAQAAAWVSKVKFNMDVDSLDPSAVILGTVGRGSWYEGPLDDGLEEIIRACEEGRLQAFSWKTREPISAAKLALGYDRADVSVLRAEITRLWPADCDSYQRLDIEVNSAGVQSPEISAQHPAEPIPDERFASRQAARFASILHRRLYRNGEVARFEEFAALQEERASLAGAVG